MPRQEKLCTWWTRVSTGHTHKSWCNVSLQRVGRGKKWEGKCEKRGQSILQREKREGEKRRCGPLFISCARCIRSHYSSVVFDFTVRTPVTREEEEKKDQSRRRFLFHFYLCANSRIRISWFFGLLPFFQKKYIRSARPMLALSLQSTLPLSSCVRVSRLFSSSLHSATQCKVERSLASVHL